MNRSLLLVVPDERVVYEKVDVRAGAFHLPSLAFAAGPFFDLLRWRVSRLQARRNPAVWIKTSRGCPFDCQICNKAVHGRTFRPKSAGRVVAEIERLASALRHGTLLSDLAAFLATRW